MKTIASRSQHIQPFQVMQLLARAQQLQAQGQDIIHMEIGEPDFATPQPIIDAGLAAMQQGQTRYTPACGIPELRVAIADYYQQRFQCRIDPQRVIVTTGASGALLLSLAALINPGDRVLLPDPGYPCNRHFVRLLDGVDVPIAVGAESAYQPNLALLQQHWQPDIKALMLASPANPTGTCLRAEQLAPMLAFAEAQSAWVLVDEIYQGLSYGHEPQTALSLSEQVIVINSFSKYFQMTGWRLGWLIVPPELVDVVERLAQNLFLSPPSVAQYAALAAFSPRCMAIVEERRAVFQQRRDVLMAELSRIGFGIPVTPDGAFYIYANCGQFTADSQQFSRDLLESAGVAITAGTDFGHHQPNTHVRIAYTNDLARLREGVQRIARFLRRA